MHCARRPISIAIATTIATTTTMTATTMATTMRRQTANLGGSTSAEAIRSRHLSDHQSSAGIDRIAGMQQECRRQRRHCPPSSATVGAIRRLPSASVDADRRPLTPTGRLVAAQHTSDICLRLALAPAPRPPLIPSPLPQDRGPTSLPLPSIQLPFFLPPLGWTCACPSTSLPHSLPLHMWMG